ncbi:hypothetical protein ACGFZA_12900 [Streptomyces sp. NPDC048211]|uniref:hypothetical protein n=1 Tax=Streptomyces sp. NPDC048211 TaxID=3365516 RepID=UPI000A979D0E
MLHRSDRNGDALHGIREQFRHPQIGVGELGGCFDVVGLYGPQVAEGAEHRVASSGRAAR